MYIYLDESGDLGFDFDRGASRYFVITLLACHSQAAQQSISKAVIRTLRRINKPKQKNRIVLELKGTNTELKHKKYFFKKIDTSEWSLYTIALNKGRVYGCLRTPQSREKLYNYLSRLLIDKVLKNNITANVRVFVDRSKPRKEIRDFNAYLASQIKGALPSNTGFKIDHLLSHHNPCLQAVDMFSWGIYRKFEYGDDEWYRIFQHTIRFSTVYLP